MAKKRKGRGASRRSVSRPWWLQITPLKESDERCYCLPYLMALKEFEEGRATEDVVAELAAHLKIAVYVPQCDPKIIDAGRRVLSRIVREWKTIEGYSDEDVEAVSAAIREYDRAVEFSGRGVLQYATKKALG